MKLLIVIIAFILNQTTFISGTYFTLIDYTEKLLSPFQVNSLERIIYICTIPSPCYGITQLKIIKYASNSYETDQVVQQCEDTDNCYPFPSDDVVNVYVSAPSDIRFCWVDPPTTRVYCAVFQNYFTTLLSKSFYVENAVRLQLDNSKSGLYVQINEPGKQATVKHFFYLTQSALPVIDLPENTLFWTVLDDNKNIVAIFFSDKVLIYINQTLYKTYELDGNGITNINEQVQVIKQQILIKLYLPNSKQIRSIQIDNNGDIIGDIRIPNICSPAEINHFSAGIIGSVWYQQLNNTLLVTLNQTYYAASLHLPNSVMIQNQQVTLAAYSQQYFEVYVLEQVIADVQKNASLFQTFQELDFQQNIKSSEGQAKYIYFEDNQDQITADDFSYNNDIEQNDNTLNDQISTQLSKDKQMRNLDLKGDQQQLDQQIHINAQSNQKADSTMLNSIQVVQQGVSLYLNPQNPCVVKDSSGNEIIVKELEINVPSIFYSNVYESVQNQHIYFSAKVNGQWRIYQSSQRQLITNNSSVSNFITMLVICLSTYFTVRGGIYYLSAYYHSKESLHIKDFIIKSTQIKISEKLFHKWYTVQTNKKLGEGAYGIVYQCKYQATNEFSVINEFQKNQLFACKILTNTPDNMDSILQEIDALQCVQDCKSAIKMINYCITNDRVYIVLELAEQSLEDYISKRYESPFTNDKLIEIALDLIEVLVQLKNKNINHRDIKPSNILIMQDESIKLTDFGAAKKINLSNFTKKSDELIGSLPWMAPELLQAIEENYTDNFDQNIEYDKCDVFSLGLTLLYVIFREKLRGCNRYEYILNNFFNQLDLEYPYIYEEFRIMLRKMTSFQPEKRPSVFLIKQHLLEIQRRSFQTKYSQKSHKINSD